MAVMVGARVKPEVLAPAGDADSLEAAVRAGADAVYFGLQDYNARIRARNFDLDALPEIVSGLHRDGVLAYVTMNTLLFAPEEAAALETVARIHAAGADAVIVQDLALARRIHAHFPDLPIHASTQMTISSREGIEFVRRFGVRRVILARELTIPEIRRIRGDTDMELEVFVHGALCVSYSGQCLSSEAWGGRSANRGQCAQACRLPYDLIVDGRARELGDRAYLLSPRDLEGFRRIPELVVEGIHGVKIEGRMKSAEYVAAATALYRSAIDRAWGCEEEGHGTGSTEALAERSRRVFSRGQSEGFLGGINHQVLVDGTTRSHRGVAVGRVASFSRGAVEIEVSPELPPLAAGDGLLFARGPLEEQETGGRIFAIDFAGERRVRIRFGAGRGPDPRLLAAGTPVYLTRDERLHAELRRFLADPGYRKRIPLAIEVSGESGSPLAAVYRDPEGRAASVRSEALLIEAERHPLDRGTLAAHLGRLGDTRYRMDRLAARLVGGLALPVGELNRMRRAAVALLEETRGGAREGEGPLVPAGDPNRDAFDLASPVSDAVGRADAHEAGAARATETQGGAAATADPFLVLCRTREQVEAALETGSARIVLDFLDLVGLKDAAATVRGSGAELTLALPRIQKPGEERIWDFFLARGPDAILVRNLASLERLARIEGGPLLVGDVSLNAVNPSSVEVLLEAGCARVAPGLDLCAEQLLLLLERVACARIEVPLHHHLPVFHTEHCVFAAFLSDGADWRTCGRPCDRHAIRLRDRTGQEHAVIADVGCRNTVFGARAQSVLHLLDAMRDHGVVHYRLELLEQDRAATAELLSIYRAVWKGACTAAEGLRRLRAEARFGIFRGAAEPPRRPQWKPQGGKRPAARPRVREKR